MMVRAPAFTFDLLTCLRALVRLDFTRKLRALLVLQRDKDPIETTTLTLKLTDEFTEHEQPLLVAMALMEIHGGDECLIPLSADRFAFYETVIQNFMIDREQDFPSIPKDQFESDIQPLRDAQLILAQIFRDAPMVERGAIEKDLTAGQEIAGKPLLN